MIKQNAELEGNKAVLNHLKQLSIIKEPEPDSIQKTKHIKLKNLTSELFEKQKIISNLVSTFDQFGEIIKLNNQQVYTSYRILELGIF